MLDRLRLARLIAAGIVAPLLTVVAAGEAGAHGAPLNPVSRSVACGSEGRATRAAACRAARAGGEGLWFRQWDNVRVANVNGRDRTTIPDGHLCSGGIAHFGGLDLARRDWPTTRLRSGSQLTVKYRATIPHQGTFRMYVTKNGYDPTRPLRWADLETKPFVTANDPPFTSGAYAFKATMPKARSGPGIVLTIWQNSSTPDTYYSCSDVVFTKAAGSATTAKPKPEPSVTGRISAVRSSSAEPGPSASDDASGTVAGAAVDGVRTEQLASAATGAATGNSPARFALAGLGLLALAGTGIFALRARRPRRRS
jgi:predicted carbohydrate-binding protein with CBM5 and CBM33 domain